MHRNSGAEGVMTQMWTAQAHMWTVQGTTFRVPLASTVMAVTQTVTDTQPTASAAVLNSDSVE